MQVAPPCSSGPCQCQSNTYIGGKQAETETSNSCINNKQKNIRKGISKIKMGTVQLTAEEANEIHVLYARQVSIFAFDMNMGGKQRQLNMQQNSKEDKTRFSFFF